MSSIPAAHQENAAREGLRDLFLSLIKVCDSENTKETNVH